MVYPSYNLTNLGNTTGIVGLVQAVNSELMFHWFGILILVAIFIITLFAFLVSTGNNFGKSLSASSFIAFALSLLLAILDLVPETMVYATLIIAGLSTAFFMFQK